MIWITFVVYMDLLNLKHQVYVYVTVLHDSVICTPQAAAAEPSVLPELEHKGGRQS